MKIKSISNLFAGRINRTSYVLGVVAVFVAGILFDTFFNGKVHILFNILFVLITTLFVIVIDIKRLHDFGRKGWWTIFGFVPLVNLVFLFFLIKTEGDKKQNKYGSKPAKSKYIPASFQTSRRKNATK